MSCPNTFKEEGRYVIKITFENNYRTEKSCKNRIDLAYNHSNCALRSGFITQIKSKQ